MSEKFTPGPWQWSFDATYGRPSLGTPDRGRLIVMDFGRMGMQGATARFAQWEGIADGAPRERFGGYMMDFTEYHGRFGMHPDARLIAAAPDLFRACQQALYALKGREHDQFLRDAIAKATGDSPCCPPPPA